MCCVYQYNFVTRLCEPDNVHSGLVSPESYIVLICDYRLCVQATKIFLNGTWVGIHRHPDELKGALLKLRRCLSISEDVSVAYDHALGEVRIYNDWGRVCRPLYVVENSIIKITKADVRRLLVRTTILLPSF